jgi:hypothetical protein
LAARFLETRIGGLHVHDAHLIRLLFGMPRAVACQGRWRGEVLEYFTTQFLYEDPTKVVTAISGAINQQGRSFTHGFEIHLEKATLQYEFAVVGDEGVLLMPLTVFDKEGGATRPELGDGDPLRAFEAEINEVVRSVTSGEQSQLLAGQLARDAVVICHCQTESAKTGKVVEI